MTYLSSIEAAEYTKIPKSTIDSLCRQGRLPARKVGRRWVLIKEEVDAFLQKATNTQHDSIRIAASAARKIARAS